MTGKETSAAEPTWHDNLIYGFHFQSADPDRGIWRSNLVLDIDHIVEWICGTDGNVKFRVAPATLIFHDVTNLKINADFSESAHRQSINELSIARIFSEPVDTGRSPQAPPYYDWYLELNLPQGGEISFGATGYTLTLRAEPQVLDEQSLPADERPPLVVSEPKPASME